MLEIIETNVQMGAPYIEKKGILGSYYTQSLRLSSGFLISKGPIFNFAPKVKKIKQNHGVVLKSRYWEISVLLNEGPDEIIEKEFEFKPSFDEYLKTMESVKSVREKRKQAANPRTRNKPRNGEENGKVGNSEEDISVEKTEVLENEKEGGTLKAARKEGFEEKSNSRNARGLVQNELEVKQSVVGSKVDVKVERKLAKRSENGRWVNNGSGSVRDVQSYDAFEGDRFRENMHQIRKRDNFQGEKSWALQNVKHRRSGKITGEDSSDDEIDKERAAFRSLDKYNDIYDKPRVSRMDMEERIQKLAKCLNGADVDMPEWMFSKMMRSAKIRFADHSILRVIQILGKLGNWRRVLQVIEWMQSRERFKSHKLRYIYTAALDALGKARRPVEALNLFYSMQQQMSSYPDIVAYHCIAVTLGQAGHMKELFDVIDRMQSPPKKKFKTGVIMKWDPRLKPDIVVYNAVLNACVHRKKWEGAFWVLQQLKEEGQQPTSTTYGLIMEVMFACGKYSLVHDFFKKAQKSSIPNALTYKVLMNTHWREGNVDKAVSVVQEMERRGIIGTGGLYYDLARSLCSAGRCQEALIQVDKICKVANKPLVVMYTGLIQACLGSGYIQDGEYIFNHMQKFCSPNLVTCNIMLKAYVENDMFEEAKDLFLKLVESGNHIRSVLDYKDRVIPDIYTFNLMLDACTVRQRWDDMEFIYKRMLQHGHHFNAKRHLRMILDAYRAGKMELLETTWKHLVEADQLPPPILAKQMFFMKLEQHDYAAAFSCVANHPSCDSPEFSRKSWSKVFTENSHRFRKETLARLVHEIGSLAAKSNSPNIILENINTCCREYLGTQIGDADFDQTIADRRPQSEAVLIF